MLPNLQQMDYATQAAGYQSYECFYEIVRYQVTDWSQPVVDVLIFITS